MGCELSVVIPAYNEQSRLGPSLERILSFLEPRGASFEVLVADDGSRDATGAVAAGFSARGVRWLRAEVNQGKGAALRRGVAVSTGRRVLLTDADLSTPIEDIALLEPRLDAAEVVIGSRAVAGANVVRHQPFYREVMGKTFNKLIRLAGVWGLQDTQCGFKLLDGDVARALFAELITPGFGYDVELVWLARQRGYKVAEVGITWENSPDSRVRPIVDSISVLFEIVRFRLHHARR